MKRYFLALCALLALLVGVYAILALANRPRVEQIQSIAHRGGVRIEPENTLAAFRLAAEDGIDWLEFDVQMTADGELVVIHDLTLDRTTDGSGAVADHTLAEIRALDAGSGEQVPTLAEVVALASELDVGIMPEIKGPDIYEGIEAKVVAEIERAGYVERSIVQSFDLDSLGIVHARQPDLALCLLTGPQVWRFPGNLPEPYHLCPMAEVVILNPLLVRRAHTDGRNVYAWFGRLENPLTVRLVKAQGADGLMADDHRMLLHSL